MKIKMNLAKRIVIAASLVLISTGIIALSFNHKLKLPPKVPLTTREVDKEVVIDTVMLRKFSGLMQTIDFNKNSFTYQGKYDVTDGKDSSNNIHDLPFLYCRKGQDFYSKIGNNEAINENGLNVYIESDRKKIVVSNKPYQIKSGITDFSLLTRNIRGEGYKLISAASGGSRRILLLNEQHITCKEISVTYDTLSNVISTVRLRFTDFSDPLNNKKDRTVGIAFTKLTGQVRLGDHPSVKDVVKEKNGKIAIAPRYAAYELITL